MSDKNNLTGGGSDLQFGQAKKGLRANILKKRYVL